MNCKTTRKCKSGRTTSSSMYHHRKKKFQGWERVGQMFHQSQGGWGLTKGHWNYEIIKCVGHIYDLLFSKFLLRNKIPNCNTVPYEKLWTSLRFLRILIVCIYECMYKTILQSYSTPTPWTSIYPLRYKSLQK